MSHDICHCEGVNCDLKEICKRYLAHLEVSGREDHKQKYAYMEPANVGKYCEAFWRDHEIH